MQCPSDLCLEGAELTGVGVSQQRADGQQNFGNSQCRAPLVLQDVQAYLPIAVNVAVVDAGAESNLRCTGRSHQSKTRKRSGVSLSCSQQAGVSQEAQVHEMYTNSCNF